MYKTKLDLQLFAPEFNPNNVMMYEKKDGTIPEKYNTLILKDVMENSKVMQLAKYEEMDGKEKEFEYFAKGPGAYWVGEGEKIKTSKAQWLKVKMVAKKLAVIIPCSREYLHYKMPDFFEIMKPKIAEAFYKKFDEAAILNMDNPFSQSVEQSVETAGNEINGDLTYDNVLSLEDLLTDENYNVNAFISTKRNRSTLRNARKIENGVVIESIYDRSNNTLDGMPVADLESLDRGTLYAGDFNYMYYGIPFSMDYKLDESAQLSTLTNPDGTPINLFEQELVALRATMDVGFMIVKDAAFSKLTAGSLKTLKVTSATGTKAGDTKVTVTPTATDSNTYKYKVGENLDMPVKGQNVKGWTVWDGSSDITAETGKEIVIAECDSRYKVVGAGKTEVKSKAGA